MIEDFKNVSNFNRDIAGWINIPNVGYFPVMQCNNNSYYLSHNEYKEVEQNGAPFLDKDCDGFRNVSLIYGHHYSSGKMFGGLEKYKEQDFSFKTSLLQYMTENIFIITSLFPYTCLNLAHIQCR